MTINDDGHSSEGLAECTKETSEAEKLLGPRIKMISFLAEKYHSYSCSLTYIQPNRECL